MKIPVAIAVVMISAEPVAAQTISVTASRWLTTPHVMDYRLTLFKRPIGPLVFLPFGQLTLLGPKGGGGATLAGGGVDLVIRLRRTARPYAVGGISAGFLDFQRTAGVAVWDAWSAGAGVELIRTGLVAIAVEVRHQALSRGGTGGVSLGVRLGSALGTGRPAGSPLGLASAASGDRPALGREVATVARSVMGAPYRWGGTGDNGFDCSGLIHFAYGATGLAVPRRSVDQARFGRELPVAVDSLAPGDILAFSTEPGGPVSHVGLYLGEGQFIHSTSVGVTQSALRADDPVGRWWFERWVGARRVVAVNQ